MKVINTIAILAIATSVYLQVYTQYILKLCVGYGAGLYYSIYIAIVHKVMPAVCSSVIVMVVVLEETVYRPAGMMMYMFPSYLESTMKTSKDKKM